MNDYADDINAALRELKSRPTSQIYQDGMSHPVVIENDISDEISEFIKQRREESERMRHVSKGVYA